MAGQCRDLGYREVNLNLGCPSGTVTAKGKGSGMLKDLDGLDRFLDAIFAERPLDISIKTRIGFANGAEFFAEEKIEIELTNGGGADKVMSAVLSGDSDIGFCGPEAALYVLVGGSSDVPTVIGQLTKRDGSFLVSRTPEPDFKWENLKGKEILAGRKGGVPAMTFEYVLNNNQ